LLATGKGKRRGEEEGGGKEVSFPLILPACPLCSGGDQRGKDKKKGGKGKGKEGKR